MFSYICLATLKSQHIFNTLTNGIQIGWNTHTQIKINFPNTQTSHFFSHYTCFCRQFRLLRLSHFFLEMRNKNCIADIFLYPHTLAYSHVYLFIHFFILPSQCPVLFSKFDPTTVQNCARKANDLESKVVKTSG